MSVRDRYLVGKLAPPDTRVSDDQVEDLPDAAIADPEGDDREAEASTSNSLVPSSLGFTFCVDGSAKAVEVRASWGRYERTESERTTEDGKPIRCWKRIPSGGTAIVSLEHRIVDPIVVDSACPDVVVQGTVGDPLPNGDRLVTLFLVNCQTKPDENQDQAWVFQPELIVRDPEGQSIFRKRPLLSDIGSDDERESLEMIYRRRVEFAVGHGVSVHATPSADDPERAVEVRTRVLPRYEVSVTETPGTAADDRPVMKRLASDGSLDMSRLAEMERADLVAVLDELANDYAAWIDEQRKRIGNDVQGYNSSATAALDRCVTTLARIREWIKVLKSDDAALEAFRFANRAMALQRVHSVYSLRVRRGETVDLASVDIPENRSWRPFQLAFILLSVPALANPVHRDRTEPVEAFADLLWFPTGGGKTEAYLGVAAFTMAIRRLQGNIGGLDGGRGLAVIMRYTLRLLTIQQFQRATTLMCAMEVLRRVDTAKWGATPFTIGLWVGQRVTPNTTQESHEAIERERDGKYGTGSTPAQFTFCPWCGSEIVPGRDVKVVRDIGRTFIFCGDKYGTCEFGKVKSPDLGLPALVVDEELYRHPPSMLIALSTSSPRWFGEVRCERCRRADRNVPSRASVARAIAAALIGKGPSRDHTTTDVADPSAGLDHPGRVPLIGGPLGTMVGLYETAVDELCSGRSKARRSDRENRRVDRDRSEGRRTANNVFLRRVAIFLLMVSTWRTISFPSSDRLIGTPDAGTWASVRPVARVPPSSSGYTWPCSRPLNPCSSDSGRRPIRT